MIARLTRLGGLAALVLISHWAWAATPEVFYVHNDQLGTPRAVVDGNNVEVWRWEGDAYGEQPPEQDPSGTGQAFVFNLRYPGQYYDVETGRMYNGWRDYDHSITHKSPPLGYHPFLKNERCHSGVGGGGNGGCGSRRSSAEL
ncbi:hypothetical protein B0T40_22935, partial [Chromobacterium haemolyticum]